MDALYRATARANIVDDEAVAVFVEHPVSAMQAAAAQGADAGHVRALSDATSIGRARAELREQLTGIVLTTAVVHGNLWLGNVLWEPTTGVVTGIVDWTCTAPGIPMVDAAHLAISTLALEQHREFGSVVRELLQSPGWPGRELRHLGPVPGSSEISRHACDPARVAVARRGQGSGRAPQPRMGGPQRAPGPGVPVTVTGHRPSRVAIRDRASLSVAALALCTALWIVSLVRIDVDAIGSLGLLSAFPITMFVALGVLTVSMARAVHRREANVVLAAHVVLFLVVVHGTPAALYETLRYAWAWKHLGLVDSLARHHVVDPHVKNLNAYQSWPGFFAAATAWLAGSGATSWTGAAQWAPLFFELLDALALFAVLDALEADRRVVWTGVWLFALGNWIGQDYFSPQAFAFFLYLVVILVVVRWLPRRPPMPRALARFARVAPVAPEEPPPEASATDRLTSGTFAAAAVVLVCTAAIASSHPLTPFVLVGAITLVALARALTLRSLPVAVVAIVVLWSITGALGYMPREPPVDPARPRHVGRHGGPEPVEDRPCEREPASRLHDRPRRGRRDRRRRARRSRPPDPQRPVGRDRGRPRGGARGDPRRRRVRRRGGVPRVPLRASVPRVLRGRVLLPHPGARSRAVRRARTPRRARSRSRAFSSAISARNNGRTSPSARCTRRRQCSTVRRRDRWLSTGPATTRSASRTSRG